ncbi:MAG: glycoside hydrolase family 30 protein [Terriglobia bacterium]
MNRLASFLVTRIKPTLQVLLISVCVTSAFGQQVKVYVSSRAGDRMTPKPPVRFVPQERADRPLFRIMTGNMFQRMDGFGASFEEAGMIALSGLTRAKQADVLRSLFDARQGAGFSAMSVPIAGSDFSSAGPWYSYDEAPGDVWMKKFSIQRDLGPDGLITYIRLARRYGKFALLASMDYPPDWMLISAKENQDVNPRYYEALARYDLRYLQEYERQGVFINYLSLFNEPRTAGEGYTQISYSEIRNLLENYVGPLLKSADVRTQIMLSEAPSRVDAFKEYPVVLVDPQARRYVAGLPYHGDGSASQPGNFDKIAALHGGYPYLPMWMTGTPSTDPAARSCSSAHLPRSNFEAGACWGNMVVSDLKAGASAWIYGNMILNQDGGPWLASSVHRDPNPQQAVIIVNRKTGKVTYTGIYDYLEHFSKFVRPGAVRVLFDGRFPGLRGVAFLSPEPAAGWHWIVELLNNRNTSAQIQVDFEVDWIRRSFRITLPAASITTCAWKPLPNTVGTMP